jgi:signal peptidase I
VKELVKTVIYAILIAVAIRTFAFEPFSIPSGSMIPTLLIGDYLFVSKYSYGYSRYSLPFNLPLIPGRIFFTGPERGDVAVFKLPSDTETDYIKRIIGLPGDRIQVREGILYINDEPVQRERLTDYVLRDRYGNVRRIPRYLETLPNGRRHTILEEQGDRGMADNTPVFTVPRGHYFAMGDNRDSSRDSRFPGVGFVPRENLVGRAEVIFFSIDGSVLQFWRWPTSIRFDRLFDRIK